MTSWKLSNSISELYRNTEVGSLVSLLELSMPPLTAFVAIGIPVSFGVLKSYAERYRTQYLVDYVNGIGPINAQRVLISTAAYLIFSIGLLLIAPTLLANDALVDVWKIAASSALLFYSLTIAATAIWYAHLFKCLSLAPAELISTLQHSSDHVDPYKHGWL